MEKVCKGSCEGMRKGAAGVTDLIRCREYEKEVRQEDSLQLRRL